jgi:dihydroneopterin aldolase
MDKIFLRGIRFFGRIGYFDHEKESGQAFVLNITIFADLREAGMTDRLDKTIHYGEVFDKAKALMDEARFDLIETYAERLAQLILSDYSLAQKVLVCIDKPNAPIDGDFDSVGVEIERSRDD